MISALLKEIGGEMSDEKGSQPPRQNYWTIFSAAFAGAVGTALAGLVISAGTLNTVVSLFRSNELPKNAVIFVTSATCEGLGQQWEPLDPNISAGHFIVGAGGNFIAGQARVGVDKIAIGTENLPPLKTSLPFKLGTLTGPDFTHGGVNFVTGLGEGTPGQGVPQTPFPITFDGHGQSISVAPSALALTACQKK
jgi:hypothetical protein